MPQVAAGAGDPQPWQPCRGLGGGDAIERRQEEVEPLPPDRRAGEEEDEALPRRRLPRPGREQLEVRPQGHGVDLLRRHSGVQVGLPRQLRDGEDVVRQGDLPVLDCGDPPVETIFASSPSARTPASASSWNFCASAQPVSVG